MSDYNSILHQKVRDLLDVYYPDSIPCNVPEFLKNLNLNSQFLPTSILFVLNFSTKGYEFVSSNISQLFSVTPEVLVRDGLLSGMHIFSDSSRDVFIGKLLPTLFSQFEKASKEGLDLRKIRVHYNVNMVSPSKGVVNTMHIIKPALMDEKGMPFLALKYVFDISDYSNESDINLTFEYVEENTTSIYFTTTFSVDNTQEVSKRESEIIKLIQTGLSSKKIADKLCISIHTVNTHRKNIMKKLNVQNFQQVYYASK